MTTTKTDIIKVFSVYTAPKCKLATKIFTCRTHVKTHASRVFVLRLARDDLECSCKVNLIELKLRQVCTLTPKSIINLGDVVFVSDSNAMSFAVFCS